MNQEELLATLGLAPGAVTLDQDLFQTGILDSLSAIELIEAVRTAAGIDAMEIAGDLSRISTMRKILELVNRSQGER